MSGNEGSDSDREVRQVSVQDESLALTAVDNAPLPVEELKVALTDTVQKLRCCNNKLIASQKEVAVLKDSVTHESNKRHKLKEKFTLLRTEHIELMEAHDALKAEGKSKKGNKGSSTTAPRKGWTQADKRAMLLSHKKELDALNKKIEHFEAVESKLKAGVKDRKRKNIYEANIATLEAELAKALDQLQQRAADDLKALDNGAATSAGRRGEESKSTTATSAAAPASQDSEDAGLVMRLKLELQRAEAKNNSLNMRIQALTSQTALSQTLATKTAMSKYERSEQALQESEARLEAQRRDMQRAMKQTREQLEGDSATMLAAVEEELRVSTRAVARLTKSNEELMRETLRRRQEGQLMSIELDRKAELLDAKTQEALVLIDALNKARRLEESYTLSNEQESQQAVHYDEELGLKNKLLQAKVRQLETQLQTLQTEQYEIQNTSQRQTRAAHEDKKRWKEVEAQLQSRLTAATGEKLAAESRVRVLEGEKRKLTHETSSLKTQVEELKGDLMFKATLERVDNETDHKEDHGFAQTYTHQQERLADRSIIVELRREKEQLEDQVSELEASVSSSAHQMKALVNANGLLRRQLNEVDDKLAVAQSSFTLQHQQQQQTGGTPRVIRAAFQSAAQSLQTPVAKSSASMHSTQTTRKKSAAMSEMNRRVAEMKSRIEALETTTEENTRNVLESSVIQRQHKLAQYENRLHAHAYATAEQASNNNTRVLNDTQQPKTELFVRSPPKGSVFTRVIDNNFDYETSYARPQQSVQATIAQAQDVSLSYDASRSALTKPSIKQATFKSSLSQPENRSYSHAMSDLEYSRIPTQQSFSSPVQQPRAAVDEQKATAFVPNSESSLHGRSRVPETVSRGGALGFSPLRGHRRPMNVGHGPTSNINASHTAHSQNRGVRP